MGQQATTQLARTESRADQDRATGELTRDKRGMHMAPKAMITGGSGFLGAAIARHLTASGFDVSSFDLGSSSGAPTHVRGNILNRDDLRAAFVGVDIVFHLAGLLGTSELQWANAEAADVNIRGTINVLETAVEQGVETVFYPTKPNDWLNTYSITKRAGEEFARLFGEQRNVDVRILRWLNAYGPGQSAMPVRKAVPVMILQALAGAEITVWGTGQQPVDLVYVDDLARLTALYTTTFRNDCSIRDTGCTFRLSVNELTDLIIRMTGSCSTIRHMPMRPGEDQDKPVQPLTWSDCRRSARTAGRLHLSRDGTGKDNHVLCRLP